MRLPTFICFLLFCVLGSAQSALDSINEQLTNTTKDSVSSILFKGAEIAIETNVDSVGYYINKLLALESTKSDSSLLMKAHRLNGHASRLKGDYVDAIRLLEPCYTYFKKQKDSTELAFVADELGIMNVFMGYNQKAQKYLFEVYEIYQAMKDEKKMAGATNGLAIFYGSNGQEDKAIERYLESLKLYQKINDTLGQANVHANLGLTYIEQQKFDKAEYHLRQQGHLDSLLNTQWGLGFHFDFMGYLKSHQGLLSEALTFNKKALEIRKKLPSQYNIAESRVSLAEVYYELKQYDNAIEQAKEILKGSEQRQSLHQQQAAYDILAKGYEAKNDFKESLLFLKKYSTIKDSIYNQNQQEQIEENNAKFQFQQQQNKIAVLDLENKANEARLQQKNRAILITSIALVLITILCGLLFKTIKKYLDQKKNLSKALKEKEILLKEIHHRVKNNLQLISGLLTLQGASIDNEQVQHALKEGKTRVRSMALIHQDLYQNKNLREVNAKTYLKRLTTELFDTYNVTPNKVGLTLDLDDLDVDIDTLVPLGLIINELISNSLKYAFPNETEGNILVSLKEKNECLNLIVKDDGIGFNLEDIAPNSFGKKLVSSLVEQLEGKSTITITSGTEINIIIQEYKTKNG